MAKSNTPAIISFFRWACPTCKKGFVFKNKSVFPLGQCTDLKDKCPICGQKLKNEINNGGGINYALTVMIFFLNMLWYWPIFGISYMDNSIYYYLITSIVVVVLLQPFLMRLSRMVYLYAYLAFNSDDRVKLEDDVQN